MRAEVQAPRREVLGLGLLFGAIYFIQGIGEPTEGLIAQPLRSLLASWGHSAGEIAAFSAVLGIPWVLKPLYGLLTDFVPILGSHRRVYLLLAGGASAAGLGYVWVHPPAAGAHHLLLALLMLPALGIAFTDVVADALMVEKGRPRGLTGRLQSVQWACLYGATIVTGAAGGYLSQHGLQTLGFLICALATAGTVALAAICVREERRAPVVGAPSRGRQAARALAQMLRARGVWAAAGFLFLWSFNPFSSSVLYMHMTREMGLGEQFYGNTVSVMAVTAVAACAAYGFYCRRVPFVRLVHLSIVAGIFSTAAYWLLEGPGSALAITVAVGFVYMSGTLVQLDLAARVCPLVAAGTTFATLMAVSNLGYALATGIGGALFDRWAASLGAGAAFDALVGAGAISTALCWLVVPALRRHAL